MSAIGDLLLASDVRPFAVAAGIVLVLGGIEALAMLVGFSISDIFGGKEIDFGTQDVHADAQHDGVLGGMFLWFNAGRLPLLILLILTLGLMAESRWALETSMPTKMSAVSTSDMISRDEPGESRPCYAALKAR